MTAATPAAADLAPPRLAAADAAVPSVDRQGGAFSRWPLAVSLALHAAVGAFLFFSLARRDQAPPPEQQAMAIEIMPMAAAPPTPPRETAPGPQRVENHQATPAPTKPEPKIPPAPVLKDVVPDVVLPPKMQETPSPAKPKPIAEETTAPAAPPAPPKPTAGAPVQGAPTAAALSAEQTWEGLVLAQIERRKHYPGVAQRAGQQDIVYVHIAIDRKGRILRTGIEKSQHLQPLDNAALDAVRRSNPLPPPPASMPGDVIEFAVPVEFFITTRRGD